MDKIHELKAEAFDLLRDIEMLQAKANEIVKVQIDPLREDVKTKNTRIAEIAREVAALENEDGEKRQVARS